MEIGFEHTYESGLDKRLAAYAKTDYYPFHMPGHKRRLNAESDAYQTDITEIEGFDNLHAPEEILKAAMERAADLYGVWKSYYLINGSTCGMLAAVSAAAPEGGSILMARNCHRAVYHAAYLRNLKTSYLYPAVTDEGIQGSITPESVERALQKTGHVDAVILTSPTYDGVVSDIRSIADLVHSYDIPLIVDEAHGAHFGLHPMFPESAASLGADLVIQSMHKTLPSLTQTALLHQCTARVSEEKLMQYLDIYQTSSPSYVLMAGMERCIRMLRENKTALFEAYAGRLRGFYQKAEELKRIRVFSPFQKTGEDCFRIDPSKIRISATECGRNGKELYDILLKRYHLQLEMCSGDYALAMTSCMDSDEGFARLITALKELDGSVKEKDNADRDKDGQLDFIRSLYTRQEACMELSKAWACEHREVSLTEAEGCIAADFVNLYPPGIPLLVPGERITAEMIKQLSRSIGYGLNVQGIDGRLRIKVVNPHEISYT